MRFANAMIGMPAEGYVAAAKAAEEAGFSSIAMSDHVVAPQAIESVYPYTPDGKPQYDPTWDFPDPWVAAAAMSAVTQHLEFFTNVFVLPARNPLLVAKALATAARISGDRVRLGVGAGWMREEFDLLGQQFGGRGKRLDEMIEVLRSVWGGGFVEHHGAAYDFAPLEMLPAPAHQIPIIVGGHSEVALRRAARLDGWIGVYYTLDELEVYCERLLGYRRELGRDGDPYEIIASPIANPTPRTLARLEAMGVSTILTSAWIAQGHAAPQSVEHGIDCIGSYGEQWIAPARG